MARTRGKKPTGLMSSTPVTIPRPGMLATVRNRRGLIVAVEPFDAGTEGRVHLTSIEYLDGDGVLEDTLLWEREPQARVLEPTALPDPSRDPPMPPAELDALVRAARWMALSPFLDPDGGGPLERFPIASPFHGAIQVEDYQLVPLLKAMRMPRVALLLADDVGLGKTIEAGLVLTELLLRRRVRRVLIICPASLRIQWRQEMRDKFALSFDVVDRPATHALQKRLGLDANPWRTFPRVITSHDYLKQADVLEQFLAASRTPAGSPHLPWDLLIVDEAHNLAPASLGDDSQVARMLKEISPIFEHRLFLTATPHNGHTRSFTGLLESLDPVRFMRKSEALTEQEKQRVEQVVVRRLKREINERSERPPFAGRSLQAVPLALGPEERALSAAFSAFRMKVHSLVSAASRGEQRAGSFAVEILGKRLLSCPVTFADSWHRYLEGVRGVETADLVEVKAAERAAREDEADDREAEGRLSHAARTVGAWLKPLADDLQPEIADVDEVLAGLGLSDPAAPPVSVDPVSDSRYNALSKLVDWLLMHDDAFVLDERLVVFTEYKTTLDYVERRLRADYRQEGVLRVLYGGMDDTEREEIKRAFNDPSDPVRILVATDAAAEGLNLQETARYLLHFDVPWNPARLEQRNGRLDRHGQARDVVVHHFTTDDDADLSFLAYVVAKVETIREDLGSVGDVFDRAFARRLIRGEDDGAVRGDLDSTVTAVRGRADVPRDRSIDEGREQLEKLRALAAEIDLDPDSLHSTLDIALGLEVGCPRLEGPDARGRFRLIPPVPVRWQDLIDDTLRLSGNGRPAGPLPTVVFDAARLMRNIGGREVFRPERDTTLLHLGHPLFHRALNEFARTRFPGNEGSGNATRWTVREGLVPEGSDALLLLTVEELAVNELRETFHHWVHTVQFPVRGMEIGDPLSHVPAAQIHAVDSSPPTTGEIAQARELWEEIMRGVQDWIRDKTEPLTEGMKSALQAEREGALARETERYRARQGEVSALIADTTIQRLERELAMLRSEADQGSLFDPEGNLSEMEQSIAAKEAEVQRRQSHYEELRAQLQRERERVVNHIIPKRYALRGQVQVFPVAVEIRLPANPRR